MSTTESFLSQLEKAASGQSVDIVEFSTMLEDISIEDPLEEEEIVEENNAVDIRLSNGSDSGSDSVMGEQEDARGVETISETDNVNVLQAMNELQSLFENIAGVPIEEEKEEIVEELFVEKEVVEKVKPTIVIDPAVLEEAAVELKGLFNNIAGIDLFNENKSTPEVIEEEPVEPLSIESKYYNLPIATPKYEISEISKSLIGHASNVMNSGEPERKTYAVENYNPAVSQGDANWQMNLFAGSKSTKMAQMVSDVANLLERHKFDLPEEEYKILQGNAVDHTVEYLNKIALSEEVTGEVEGAGTVSYESPEFETKVNSILRKVLSGGAAWGSNVGWGQDPMSYGSGEVQLKRLDDVDATNISATHQFLAWDASVSKFVAAEGTTPVGDISGVVAGIGLSGGGTTGTVTLDLDVSELTALGTTAALTDYVVIQDVTDNSTKKVLVSNLPGDIKSVTAGTGLSGGGTAGDVTITLDTVSVALGGTGITAAAKGSVLIANTADTISALSGSTDGDVLTYNSGTDTVSWSGSVDGGTY